MVKIESKFGTTRICKDHIGIRANVKAVNDYVRDKDDLDPYILKSYTEIRQDKDGWWIVYEDCTFWDDAEECWVRDLNMDGSMRSYYQAKTLLEALYLAWASLLNK